MAFIENLFLSLAEHIERYEHQDFLESVTGVCALVSSSNGNVGPQERARFKEVVRLLSRLKCYEADDVLDQFNQDLKNIKNNAADAEKAVLQKVKGTIKSKSDKELILKICWAMSRADGNVDRKEEVMIETIAKELGLNQRDIFNSY
ncbi:MAG: TerB family tellurite resistance protein [Methylocystaceae bacterium]|nr:TerB family tellurite resistance protein [Methylocystaceae bacterium]